MRISYVKVTLYYDPLHPFLLRGSGDDGIWWDFLHAINTFHGISTLAVGVLKLVV